MAAAQAVCGVLFRFYENANAKALPATSEAILGLLNQANDEILAWGMIQDAVRSLGACAGTAIWVDEGWVAHVFHAGDTSALLIRDGIVQQLTTVHHSAAGHLTSYFGLDYLQLETRDIQLEEGDRLLLLSDGITKALYNQQITPIWSNPSRRAQRVFPPCSRRQITREPVPLHLVVDGLPAHKKKCVKEYVASLKGRLQLHFLPDYAPELNPDELVWSYAKRTGTARRPLRTGEKLAEKVDSQLNKIRNNPSLVRSFFDIQVSPVFLTYE